MYPGNSKCNDRRAGADSKVKITAQLLILLIVKKSMGIRVSKFLQKLSAVLEKPAYYYSYHNI